MAKRKKERFAFGRGADIKIKSEGKEVDVLQKILTELGYLRGTFQPGMVCKRTERAVRRYQRFYDLKVDGVVGPKTKSMIERVRCGVPDIPVVMSSSAVSPYVLRGCSYSKQNLTYSFLNGTSDLTAHREREIVRQAFSTWSAVANLRFSEVPAGGNPDFRIAWHTGNHGDGSSFDGPGNTLAHAFFPPPCGGPNAGDMHFDEAESWTDNPNDSGIMLLQVAIHEIGHLLGLSHSEDESAIMYAYYSADRVNLSQDDINGIQALYGAPSQVQNLNLQATTGSRLGRTGEEHVFEFTVPETLAVSVEGPDDADFDLYIRKNNPPTESEWDYRAYTVSSDEQIVFPAENGARYYIMVRSFEGKGNYQLKINPSGG